MTTGTATGNKEKELLLKIIRYAKHDRDCGKKKMKSCTCGLSALTKELNLLKGFS